MGEIRSNVPVQMVSLEATVIRANGDQEPLGVIAFYHKNPLRRLTWRLSQLRKGR